MREQADCDPEERLHLHALAMRLDQLAEGARENKAAEQRIGEEAEAEAAAEPPLTTDWAEMVEDVAASKVDEHGNPRSEFEAAAVLQRKLADNVTKDSNGTSSFRLTPASVIPTITNLGQTVLVKYGGNANTGSFTNGTVGTGVTTTQEQQIIRWDGREYESQICTITIINPGVVGQIPKGTGYTSYIPTSQYYTAFQGSTYYGVGAYTLNGGSVPNQIFRPYWHLLWGTSKGVPNECFGDCGRGVQFTIAASFIYVNVGMLYTDGLLTQPYGTLGTAPLQQGTNPGAMLLGGTLGFFAGGRSTPITYTLYIDNLNPTTTFAATIPIPPFAATIEALHSSVPNWSIEILDNLQQTIGYAEGIVRRGDAITLPNSALALRCTNNSADIASAQVVFGLSV